MALGVGDVDELMPGVIQWYKRQRIAAKPKHYADKSHPNIWLIEHLVRAFPDALFVGTQRQPYATVASMLRTASLSDTSPGAPTASPPLSLIALTAASTDA